MTTEDILRVAILDSTNKLLSEHNINKLDIEPPLLTDKVNEEAIAAYTSNAGPDANAWVELEKMAEQASMMRQMLQFLKPLSGALKDTNLFPCTAESLDYLIAKAEALL